MANQGSSSLSLIPSSITQDTPESGSQASLESTPSQPDFWDMARQHETRLQERVPRLLADAATYFNSPHFTHITTTMQHIVHATATFRANIQGTLDAHHVSLETFTKEVENIFVAAVSNMQKFSLPDKPDKAPGHPERAALVDKILDDAKLALVNLATQHGIKEEVVTDYLFVVKPQLHALVVTVGDINEQYPRLFSFIAFSIASLLIPESWILKPVLGTLGFGPAGPIKGSAAAWMQSYFWGGAVQAGSWFSWLQAAGMGVYPTWAGHVVKAPLTFLARLLARRFRAPRGDQTSRP